MEEDHDLLQGAEIGMAVMNISSMVFVSCVQHLHGAKVRMAPTHEFNKHSAVVVLK